MLSLEEARRLSADQLEVELTQLDFTSNSEMRPPMPREYRDLFAKSRVNWEGVYGVAGMVYESVEFGSIAVIGGLGSCLTGDVQWAILGGAVSIVPMWFRETRLGLCKAVKEESAG